ncbi:hypothetical protein ACIHFE_14035 [Streptomyces sp. NPDC052396]|uniref:hypothetical protein n=1 Tax=Streptomyces sp. NPDC052396 TaxID=3365689 RepID=UPI0037D734AE
MRTYVGAREAATPAEGQELTLGFGEDFEELFAGRPDESAEERAARKAAARDILAELQEHSDADEIAFLNALYAAQLSNNAVVIRSEAASPLRCWAGKAA